MKHSYRFSLLTLLVVTTVVSLYAASAKLFGMNSTSMGLIVICSVLMLGMAFRIYFLDR